jgi:hypothetical protein
MNIETFVLCDYAQDQQGKLTVVGAFDTLWVSQTPAAHPHCAIAVRIRFENTEAGRHSLRIAMINEDGAQAGVKAEGDMNVVVPQGLPSLATHFIIGMMNQQFPKLGTYHIDLILDGALKARIPLFIRDVKEMRKAA